MVGLASVYINPKIIDFKADRESKEVKEPLLKQRELELQTEIPEDVKKFKKK